MRFLNTHCYSFIFILQYHKFIYLFHHDNIFCYWFQFPLLHFFLLQHHRQDINIVLKKIFNLESFCKLKFPQFDTHHQWFEPPWLTLVCKQYHHSEDNTPVKLLCSRNTLHLNVHLHSAISKCAWHIIVEFYKTTLTYLKHWLQEVNISLASYESPFRSTQLSSKISFSSTGITFLSKHL